MAGERRPLVAGNWKMNLNRHDASALATGVAASAREHAGAVDVAVFPAFPHLDAVCGAISQGGFGPGNAADAWLAAGESSGVVLGAQDVHHEADGAFTGEVSTSMLKDMHCSAVLIGHSERRHVIGEEDALLNKKLHATLRAGLCPVLCIGETIEQREAGETDAVNERQLRAGLEGVSAGDAALVVIAYEPVWAIGTGKTATPTDAQDAHAKCRSIVADIFDQSVADRMRILYGGSMKPGNAGELIAQPDIDGGLIGGASLKAGDFGSIIDAAAGVATA
jgi:triosephosphate isomerase